MNMAIDRYRDQLAKNHIEYHTIIRNPVVQEHELLEVIEQYDGVICSDDEFTRKVLEKAKRLKVISKWGVGINSIDLDTGHPWFGYEHRATRGYQKGTSNDGDKYFFHVTSTPVTLWK